MTTGKDCYATRFVVRKAESVRSTWSHQLNVVPALHTIRESDDDIEGNRENNVVGCLLGNVRDVRRCTEIIHVGYIRPLFDKR